MSQLFKYISKFFNSKLIWTILLITTINLDAMLSIFAFEGGMKDGLIWHEEGVIIKNAIDSGNKGTIIILAISVSLIIGLQLWLWDKHWIWRTLWWILLVYRFFASVPVYII